MFLLLKSMYCHLCVFSVLLFLNDLPQTLLYCYCFLFSITLCSSVSHCPLIWNSGKCFNYPSSKRNIQYHLYHALVKLNSDNLMKFWALCYAFILKFTYSFAPSIAIQEAWYIQRRFYLWLAYKLDLVVQMAIFNVSFLLKNALFCYRCLL